MIDYTSSFLLSWYSNISPGWQSKASQDHHSEKSYVMTHEIFRNAVSVRLLY